MDRSRDDKIMKLGIEGEIKLKVKKLLALKPQLYISDIQEPKLE